MKRIGHTLAAVVAAALLLCVSPAALAEGEPSGKEEVVYINLDASGAVETVDVVNIFDLAQAGEIEDHGDYASVRNMTGTEPLQLEDGTVTAQAGPGRLYYEGRLDGAECPWTISLRYFLDGEERPAAELAGRSGALEIRMTVEKNPACAGDFFENYALQASLTLDGDRCAGIEAPGATVANVGGDKKLTYTILPGMGADVSVTAQVTDLEMEPISINGVRLALDVGADDGDLTELLGQLTQAVTALDEGAGQVSEGLTAVREQADGALSAGAAQLAGGAGDVKTGADALKTGSGTVDAGAAAVKTAAEQVDGGVQDLNAGLTALAEGLESLNGQSAGLTGGSAQTLASLQSIQQAVTALNAQMGAAAAALGELQAGVDALVEQYTALDAGLQAYTQAVSDADTGAQTLTAGGAALVEGSASLAQGAGTLADGTARLAAGVGQLAESAGTLAEGAEGLSGGAAQLSEGLAALGGGAAALKEGAAALRTQADGLDGQLGGLMSGVAGGTGETVSFVSAENTAVTSVQFVLRTPAIQKAAPETPAPEPEPERSFWEKLTALF